MARLADFDVVPSWFAVLPDGDAVCPLATAIRRHAPHEISHPSGRPWLLGRWADGSVTTGEARHTKIAVIGQHAPAATADQLSRAAGAIRTIGDVDVLAESLVGSSHLVASVDGRVRLQGSVTGIRRVFRARIGGATIAADRADVLASLLDAYVDPGRLALHLLEPHILYPLAGQPVWQAVEVLPTDQYLVLDAEGTQRSVRWWAAPEPDLPMAEGAMALREALSAAVGARVGHRDLVSSDLGGLDSTAVCCVAARGAAKLVAYTATGQDPQADDGRWALRTVAGLGNVEHHVIPVEEMPLPYHGVLDTDDLLDEPCTAAVDLNRGLVTVRRAAARGSQMHLTGFGGDELLYGSLAHLHSLMRTRPRVALRHIRGFATKYRWPRGALMRQLADRSPYDAWLARVADDITAAPAPMEEPLLDWGFQPRLPPWITADAADTVRTQIRAEAQAARPLAPLRGQHRELETMRFVARIARQFDQMATRMGTGFAAPYHDDRVIEAGLGVRPEDRITPWRYKPLIVEAMRGIVPDDSRARQTKANASCEEETGLREHRAELFALCEDSRLARLGLIDADALRDVCSRPLSQHLLFGGLDQTVACEVWLRSLERSSADIGRGHDAQAA